MPLTSRDLQTQRAEPHAHRLVRFDVGTSTQQQRRAAETELQRLGPGGKRDVLMCVIEGCDHIEIAEARRTGVPPGGGDKMLRPEDLDKKDMTS